MTEKRKILKTRLFGNTKPKSARRLADGGQAAKGPAAAPGFSAWVLPIAIFYDELVFKWSTTVRPFGFNVFLIAAGSAVLGLLLWLPVSFIRSPSWHRRIKRVLLLIIALMFCIEYFVYWQFKTFYDLNTIFNGAGHMLRGFLKETLELVFSLQGLAHILLFFLPALLYAAFGRIVDPVRPLKASARLIAAAMAVHLLLLDLGIICAVPVYKSACSSRYSFQNAVDTFGLMSAVRLDVRNDLFSSQKVQFEMELPAEEPAEEPVEQPDEQPVEAEEPEQVEIQEPESAGAEDAAPEEPEVPEIPLGDNKLDIDFKALAENAGYMEATLDEYVSTLKASNKNQYTGLFAGKNLIMITAEAFTAEVIDPKLTPTLYRLANKGIVFKDYTQSATAGTTGGEFAHIFGMLPVDSGMSMREMANHKNYYTMGSQLDRLGYYGKAYHNSDYTYYARNITHASLGYSDGFMGYGNGMEEFVTMQWPESDLEMIEGTLPDYIDKPHFNIYYMTVSGHNGYYPGSNSMTDKHWDQVQDLPYESKAVKGYIACNLELEAALTALVDALEEKGIADDTVICLTADHFPYGLDNGAVLGNLPLLEELYGYPVKNYLERDHNRLIIWSGCLEEEDPIVVADPVSCVDILPTLSNLFGLEFDSRLMPGRDVFSDTEPLVWTLFWDWKTDLGTYIAARNTFTPVSEDTVIPEGYVERIQTIVSNKIAYCRGCLKCDYFAHVFPDE
ncbi:MAG: sulfatase-like hydrolase/transferase [Oscillospiraceae bacterium]|nr:sulfatase-like hydrolase/transferase [Oscillospiraceae bacterium]